MNKNYYNEISKIQELKNIDIYKDDFYKIKDNIISAYQDFFRGKTEEEFDDYVQSKEFVLNENGKRVLSMDGFKLYLGAITTVVTVFFIGKVFKFEEFPPIINMIAGFIVFCFLCIFVKVWKNDDVRTQRAVNILNFIKSHKDIILMKDSGIKEDFIINFNK